MSNKKIKDGNFVTIQSFMINELNLKGAELIVYAIIYGFTQDGESWYSDGLSYICNWVGRNKNTVSSIITELTKKGYLEKDCTILSDGSTVIKTLKIRALYDKTKSTNEEMEINSKYSQNSNPKSVTNMQILKYCKESCIPNEDCRKIKHMVNRFIYKYECISYENFSYQSKQSMKNFVEVVKNELCSFEYEELDEIVDMYFNDASTFKENGCKLSIHHMVSDGILENYIKRLM